MKKKDEKHVMFKKKDVESFLNNISRDKNFNLVSDSVFRFDSKGNLIRIINKEEMEQKWHEAELELQGKFIDEKDLKNSDDWMFKK